MMKWRSAVKLELQEQFSIYAFVSVLFLMGIVFGALLVNALSFEQKRDVSQYLGSFFNSIVHNPDLGKTSFIAAFGAQFKWLALIWLMGLSIIGLPIVLIFDFLKGILLGFTVGYFVGEFSWKGMVFALASLAPHNIIFIPALLISSVAAISFSVFVIRNRFLHQKGSLRPAFTRYCFLTLATCGLAFAAALVEAFISPRLIEWSSTWMIGL